MRIALGTACAVQMANTAAPTMYPIPNGTADTSVKGRGASESESEHEQQQQRTAEHDDAHDDPRYIDHAGPLASTQCHQAADTDEGVHQWRRR
jgi:hypothetical protein